MARSRSSSSGRAAKRTGPDALLSEVRTSSGSARARLKGFLIVVLTLGLLGIAIVAAGHEAPEPQQAIRRPVVPTPRPALSAAEEAYIKSLWPIHVDVERALVRVTLAQIFYKTNDLDRATLRTRLDDALAGYRLAEMRMGSLDPPQSLQGVHDDYVSAIGLLKDSAVEILKMYDDGSDDHLLVAYPLSQRASDKIRNVGGRFWPQEFPPN